MCAQIVHHKDHLAKNPSPSFDEDSWDDLDENKYPIKTRMFAGGVAGLAEHLFVYPLDNVKTNLQLNVSKKHLGVENFTKLWRFVRSEKAWSGAGFNTMPVFVAHALQFPAIEYCTSKTDSSLIGGISGAFAHDIVMTPANVIKQRRQVCHSQYKNSWICTLETFKNEGFVAFYRSFPTQVAQSMVFMGTYYYIYNDFSRKQLEKYKMTSQANHPIINFFLRSSIGTIVATMVTLPIDAICTRINTQYSSEVTQSVRQCPSRCANHICPSNSRFGSNRTQIHLSQSLSNHSRSLRARAPPAIRKLQPPLPNHNHHPGTKNFGKALAFQNKVTIRSAFRDVWLRGDTVSERFYNGAKQSSKGFYWRLGATLPANIITWGVYESLKYVFDKYGY